MDEATKKKIEECKSEIEVLMQKYPELILNVRHSIQVEPNPYYVKENKDIILPTA